VSIGSGPPLTAVACPTATQCTAVDIAGHAITFDPTAPAGASTSTISRALGAIACPSAAQCTAVGIVGQAVTFDPVSPAGATSTRVPGAGALSAVTCPSTHLCIAADVTGNAFIAQPAPPPTPTPTPIPAGPGGGGQPTPGSTPVVSTGPSAAQIKASLLRQLTPHGKASRIGALLRHGGYTFSFHALTGGTVVIRWHSGHVLVAVGKVKFTRAGNAKLTIKLTKAGRRLLREAKRATLTANGAFTPVARPTISAAKRFHLGG
jgi:hypothetical protein